ncbi:TPA: restriction endonuclease subunit S, partial [Aeromonas hydrophila]
MSELVATSQQGLVGKYKPYPEYKDSGISRLGNIPNHWQSKKLKRMASIENGRDYKHIEVSEGFPVIGSGGQFTWSSEYIYNGESVLLGRKGTVDRPLYIDGPFWTVDTMFYTKVYNIIPAKFLYYAALTIEFGLYSTNTALPSMTQEDLGNVYFGSPTYEEAENIAAFLDYETARIDRLIAQQQRLIELLKEKRQAVISHAVTKGLNSDAPMKDSGIEWLGQVPEHWVVTKVKDATYRIVDGPHFSPKYQDEGYMFISARNIKVDRWSLDDAKYVSESDFLEFNKRVKPESGDVLLTKGGTTG